MLCGCSVLKLKTKLPVLLPLLPCYCHRSQLAPLLSRCCGRYHVHEKAVLMVAVPLAALVGVSGGAAAAREHQFLAVLGTYSLFPLLFGLDEYPIKVRGGWEREETDGWEGRGRGWRPWAQAPRQLAGRGTVL